MFKIEVDNVVADDRDWALGITDNEANKNGRSIMLKAYETRYKDFRRRSKKVFGDAGVIHVTIQEEIL